MSYGIESVRDRHDARRERNTLSLEMTWISLTVPSFVMTEDSVREVRIERGQRLQYMRTAPRVRHYCLPLVGSESAALVDDVGESAVDFANVVKQRDPLDAVLHSFVQVGRVREQEGVLRNATHMGARCRVVRIDGIEKGLERRRPEPLKSNPPPSLADVQRTGCGRQN